MTETTGPGKGLPPQFGPRPGWVRRAEVERQVDTLVMRLLKRVNDLDVVLRDGLRAEYSRKAGALTLMLASDEPAARQTGARAVAVALLDVGERDSPEFWETDLGRVIAREIGYATPYPSKYIARAVLGVSRQAVDQMITRGDLEGGEGSLISRQSLQRAAAKRWPREADR